MGRVNPRVRKVYIARRIGASIAAILLILCLIFIIVRTKGYVAVAGTGNITETADYNAVIVRDEQVISADAYADTEFKVEEGAFVEKGTHVMDLYKRGYNEEIMLAYQRSMKNLYEAQIKQLGETRDLTLIGYNEAIDVLESRIADISMQGGDTNAMLETENQLIEVLQERTEYLKGSLQLTKELADCYKDAEEKLKLLDSWRVSLYAEKSGRVSFYIDDYENALNKDKLSIITGDIVGTAIRKRNSLSWQTKSETSAYRIVNDNEWYCVYLTSSKGTLRASENTEYEIDVKGFGKFNATGLKSAVTGDYVVNILKVEAPLGDLINVRNVKVNVKYSGEGVKVEERAIVNDAEGQYIDVRIDGSQQRIYVNVISVNGGTAVVRQRDGKTIILKDGVRYWVPRKKIINLSSD